LIHLALPAPSTPAAEISDSEWRTVFAHLVDPMPRLVSAVLPQMVERRAGRILLMGRARSTSGPEAPPALQRRARRADRLCAVGRAWSWRHRASSMNAIAQNFVANPTYYGPEVQANPRFRSD